MKEKQEQKKIYVNEIDGELVHTRDMTEVEFAKIKTFRTFQIL